VSGARERSGLGWPRLHLRRTDSTNERARELAAAGAPHGTLVTASEQTAGRGRQGRRWQAPANTALLASVLVRTGPATVPGVPFAAGLAVLDALDRVAPIDAQLKWPNDVMAGGRKLAGILTELEPGAAPEDGRAAGVVGLGLNLRVPSFPAGADGVSLDELAAVVPGRDRVLNAWLDALWRRIDALEARGMPALLDEWRRRAVGLGATVTATTARGAVAGIAEDIADDGSLLVRTRDGVVRLVAGDVHIGASPPDG